MKIVYLTPRSAVRDFLRSDTLWGHLVWGINLLFGEDEASAFISTDPQQALRVSSTFPFLIGNDDDRTPLFPRPPFSEFTAAAFDGGDKKKKMEELKTLKKRKAAKYITDKELLALIEGTFDTKGYFENTEHAEPDITSSEVVHNTINRLTGTVDEGLYTKTDLALKKTGMFFLMTGNEEKLRKAISSLRFFSHTGVGGDANLGKGYFDITIDDFKILKASSPTHCLSLSLLSPADEDLTLFMSKPSDCRYEIENRKGKAGGRYLNINNFWKRSTLMIREGALLPFQGNAPYGKTTIVKEQSEQFNHNIYQNGFALTIPIKLDSPWN